jgi:hypothetical protein
MDPEELASGASLLPLTAAEHTGLINSVPDQFGQLNADGMFPTDGLDTPYVRVDMDDGVITALPVTDGGRPSTIARHGKGKGVIFEVPNVSHEDSVLAGDIRKWLAYAKRTRTPDEALINKIETRHKRNRLKFSITLEIMKLSSLKGLIVDGANTLIYDLYDAFGVTKRTVYFDLDDPDFDVPEAIESVLSGTEDNLVNDTMTGLETRMAPEFYSKLIRHPSVERYFAGTPAMLQLLNQQREKTVNSFRRVIEIAGVTIREYRARVKLWGQDGTTRLLGATEAVSYPTGTIESHITYAAPPLDIRELDGSEASSSDEDLIHFSEEVMKHGAGLEWKYQMNALPIWRKPALTTEWVYGPQP